MTEIDNDKLLKDFFAENKREIADNGFSRRVWGTLKDVLIGMINHGATSLDPKSIIIATVVLLFMAGRKVVSMA